MFNRLVLLPVGLSVLTDGMLTDDWATAGLWLAVAVSGIYHGVNPGMGWPLAVSAGLMGRDRRDVFSALGPIAFGHLLAMTGVLLPFGAMTFLVIWQQEIQLSAAFLLIAFGVALLIYRRHPRFLSRIRPTQLALWSFAVAMAHGAGLMLVPIYLGLCRVEDLDTGHQAAMTLMAGNLATAALVALLHTLAMVVSGGAIAVAVYEWLGLRFISQSWLNLDVAWALSLVLVGTIALVAILS